MILVRQRDKNVINAVPLQEKIFYIQNIRYFSFKRLQIYTLTEVTETEPTTFNKECDATVCT